LIPLDELTADDARRFWEKVNRTHPHECWAFTGRLKPKGYGRFYVGTSRVAAHRVAWALVHGDPGELEIDHTCRTRDCVNPTHLEAVHPDENRARRIEHYRKEGAR